MRKSVCSILGALAAVLACTSVQAGTLIPVVPYPGSDSTEPFDINDQNIIGGSYALDDGTFHAFFGTLDGQYTSFDGDNYAGYSQVNGINTQGWITGVYRNSELCPDDYCAFVRKPNGIFVSIKKNGAVLEGYPRQLTSSNRFVGSYLDLTDYTDRSFIGKKTKFKKALPIALDNPVARGMNNSGTVVGRFNNSDGTQSGFVFADGAVSIIEYPDPTAVDTTLYGINDKGLVTGTWDNGAPDYIFRGFVFDTKKNTFRQLKIKGENAYTFTEGINNAGFIAIRSDAGNFIYCPKKRSECPGGTMEASFGPPIHVSSGWLMMHHPSRHPHPRMAISPRVDPDGMVSRR